MWDTWCYGGVSAALYGISDSGWMQDKNFETWFIEAFVPKMADSAATHHRVLLYDGHNSHITYPTIRTAIDNNVSIVCLPPNTSHALQPLDVRVFRSVKASYFEECQKWFEDS